MIISDKNRANKETIQVYEEIDGLEVMKEVLLHKGEDIVIGSMRMDKKLLDNMALIVYGLKSNPTNKLYIGFALDRYFKRLDMVTPNGTIKVPVKIYEEVKAINDKYRPQVLHITGNVDEKTQPMLQKIVDEVYKSNN